MPRAVPALSILALAATAAPAAAACWSASSPASGPQVEICEGDRCDRTALVLECARPDGAILDYANGWRIEVSLGLTGEETRVTRPNGTVLGMADLAGLGCTELDDQGGCRFPEVNQPSADQLGAQLGWAEYHFRNALPVDSENVQLALAEAGFYRGPIDGRWGPGTARAFAEALGAARAAGLPHDLQSVDGYWDFHALLVTRLAPAR
jgi:hypothetical protein